MIPAFPARAATRPVSTRVAGFLLLSPLLLLSCLRDDGLVDPDKKGSQPLLARFAGTTQNEGDTTLSAARLLKLGKPKIALVWQQITLKADDVRPDLASVGAVPPYDFDLSMLSPPPPEVLAAKSVVLGSFWLYSDGDGNGRLDRITHPELKTRFQVLDSLEAVYEESLEGLMEAAEVRPRVNIKDTFHVTSSGYILERLPAGFDTLYRLSNPGDTRFFNYMHRRYRILDYFNKWESFFALRKKEHDMHQEVHHVDGFAFVFVHHRGQRLFPRPGREEEFRQRMKEATAKGLAFTDATDLALGTAAVKGWLNYPYDGFTEPGTDWVAGRTRRWHVLYIPDAGQLEVVLRAEKRSSFNIDGLDRMRTGYNLLNCDEHYRCRVAEKAKDIRIDLGERWDYFDPPSSPVVFPIKTFEPATVQSARLDSLEGHYDYQPFRPIVLVADRGGLWGDFPDFGLRRILPRDSMTFYSPGEDLQVEFVAAGSGSVSKLMVYSDSLTVRGKRGVALKTGTTEGVEALAERVAALMDRRAGELSDSLAAALPLRLEFGRDSAVLSAFAGGDSLRLDHSRFPDEVYFPLNDSQAASATSSHVLTWERRGDGQVAGLLYRQSPGSLPRFLPNAALPPLDRNALLADSVPALDSVVSGHEGSGADTYVGLGNFKRYGCATDARYLRAGDGWLSALALADGSDSISSLSGKGGIAFRLEGLAGKQVRLELKACAEKGAAKPPRVNLVLKGGGKPGEGVELAPPHWVDLAKDSLSWQPIKVTSDPYYLEIETVPTLLPPFRFALDRYRILTHR